MHNLATILLVCAPFLLGLNTPLAWSLFALILTTALWQTHAAAPAHPARPSVVIPRRVMLLSAGAFAFALPLAQLAHGVCTDLPSALPCAANPEQSWLSLVMALMLAQWFLLLTGPARPSANNLLAALTVAATLHAFYGLLAFFLDITPLFLANEFRHEQVPTGGFTNRNHFAAFLYIGIFAGIALVLRLPADTGTGRAGRWRMLLDQRLVWRLAIMVMVLALIATRSRGGNAAFVLGLLAGLAWLLLVERRRQPAGNANRKPLQWRFVALVIGSVLTLDAVLVGSVVGLDKLQQRIADTSLESEQRGVVNEVLFGHPELFTAGGHGAASFVAAFEPVKPANLQAIYDQAHNDYLQVLVERGWIGGLLFIAALTTALWLALGPASAQQDAALRFALVAATTALLLHASVEFVTQIPALWLAWLTLLAGTLAGKRRRRKPSGQGRYRHMAE